jgi:phenylacetate-CoA ligase
MSLQSKYETYRRRQILKFLRNSKPEYFEDLADKKLIPAFIKAYRESPAYRQLITDTGLNPESVKSVADFSRMVPVTRKNNYYGKYDFQELTGNNSRKVKLAMTSSGYSGTFAYGFTSGKVLKTGRLGVDTTLDYWFDISHRKTFLINCAPMGVHVETSLPLAETSVRSDMAVSLLQKVSPWFDQTILVGDPNFIKKIAEEGVREKINWNKLCVSIITAQDWLAESLRSYIARLIDLDPDNPSHRGIFATMGMTELGLNVFHESKYTVALRRKLRSDNNLRSRLVSSSMQAPPCFFHYYPFRTYIETAENESPGEFLFTNLSDDGIVPVIRYNTGDTGDLLSYNKLYTLLNNRYNDLLPDLKLPIGIMYGRKTNIFHFKDQYFYLEDVKEGLFTHTEVAACITGLTGIRIQADHLKIQVHLQRGIKKSDALNRKIMKAANHFLSFEGEVEVFEYYDLPEALELNYEKKLFIR